MRLAYLLPAALLVTGCGVPDVSFTDAGNRDATRDAPHDAPGEAASDAETDAEGDAGGDAVDAAYDGPEPCKGDAGPPSTGNYRCCNTIGTVCSGSCTMNQCILCEPCAWPSVCCTGGGMAKCLGPGSC